jgi:hypothetical protein
MIPSIDARPYCSLFHATASSNLMVLPPKMSSALPIVKSILPLLSFFTNSRSCKWRPPPAYVTGMVQIDDKSSTSSVSIPACLPSTSAAWMRNSAQCGSRRAMFSWKVSRSSGLRVHIGKVNSIRCHLPLLIAKSVIVCHLSMATRHPPSTRRQLRSMTSFSLSPPSAASTACRRSRANVPDGKRKDVMMTYREGKKKCSAT